MVIHIHDAHPDQVGATFGWSVPLLRVFTERGQMRRVEHVWNERIVDESSSGWIWTVTTDPVPAGTRLTFRAQQSSAIPFLAKLDAAVFRVDRLVDRTLATLKRQLETTDHSTLG